MYRSEKRKTIPIQTRLTEQTGAVGGAGWSEVSSVQPVFLFSLRYLQSPCDPTELSSDESVFVAAAAAGKAVTLTGDQLTLRFVYHALILLGICFMMIVSNLVFYPSIYQLISLNFSHLTSRCSLVMSHVCFFSDVLQLY